MKNLIQLILFALIVISQLSCTSETKQQTSGQNEEPKPNIILILADDMGYSDLSCYGSEINTPNIDKLANEGIRFTQFYNAARCCPTRASLLTGLYPHQAGMGGMVNKPREVPEGPYQGYLSKHSVTIAEVLKQANYYTVSSGKWHVGEERPHWPTDRGFDNYYGLISGAANYFDISKTKKSGVVRHFAIDSTEYMPPNEGFYMTNAITENAVKYLQKAATKDQPFFMYVAYTAPHWPLHALQEDIDLYKGKYLKGWDTLRAERFDRMLKMGIIDKNQDLSERNEGVTAWNDLSEEEQERMDVLMSIYAAQVHRLDQGIGLIMNELKRLGQAENTIIMFLSDNGGSGENDAMGSDFWGNFWDGNARPGSGESYHTYGSSWANLSNTPFRYYKKDTYEGGIATPFIVKWPGKIAQKGSITHSVGHINDVMATICDITGVEYPETYKNNTIIPMQGKSFAPLLLGEETANKREIFWEHNGNRAARKGDWKLVAKKDKAWALYNLKEDRTESNNLINDNKEIAEDLIKNYETWAKEVGVNN
ncbi:arylsulfatase [uncultured Draconibacterium sp.]|uniref:arylsulfatase n=1 Tax=uncultured Draconibacterium sp. TaxID=1573823 RepID=UPI003216A281